jgi:RHS repeat-associated protein
VQTSYGYDPYGASQVTGTASDNPYQYTGRENDRTGLLHYRARYYNPTWARFVSEDPIGLDGGINVYAYAGNNPIQLRDPSGNIFGGFGGFGGSWGGKPLDGPPVGECYFFGCWHPSPPSPSPASAKNGGTPLNGPLNKNVGGPSGGKNNPDCAQCGKENGGAVKVPYPGPPTWICYDCAQKPPYDLDLKDPESKKRWLGGETE